jgi:hypothetical protein
VDRPRLAIALGLVVVVALYAVATAAGVGAGDRGSLGQGLPSALGGLLVQPAAASDVRPDAPACRAGGRLLVPAGGSCGYGLSSGFLARRLRLGLVAGDEVTAVLLQPDPRARDARTLDAGRPRIDMTYRESGSRLTLGCASASKAPCVLSMG